MQSYPYLGKPLYIGKLTIKNRFCMALIGGGQHHLPGGGLKDETIRYLLQMFAGLFLQDKMLIHLAAVSIRKMIYIICLGVLPLLRNIENIFYARATSDMIGALFSLILFFGVINSKLKHEMCFQDTNDIGGMAL